MALDYLHVNHILHRDVKVKDFFKFNNIRCYKADIPENFQNQLFMMLFPRLFQCSNIFLTKNQDIRLGKWHCPSDSHTSLSMSLLRFDF